MFAVKIDGPRTVYALSCFVLIQDAQYYLLEPFSVFLTLFSVFNFENIFNTRRQCELRNKINLINDTLG